MGARGLEAASRLLWWTLSLLPHRTLKPPHSNRAGLICGPPTGRLCVTQGSTGLTPARQSQHLCKKREDHDTADIAKTRIFLLGRYCCFQMSRSWQWPGSPGPCHLRL